MPTQVSRFTNGLFVFPGTNIILSMFHRDRPEKEYQ